MCNVAGLYSMYSLCDKSANYVSKGVGILSQIWCNASCCGRQECKFPSKVNSLLKL